MKKGFLIDMDGVNYGHDTLIPLTFSLLNFRRKRSLSFS